MATAGQNVGQFAIILLKNKYFWYAVIAIIIFIIIVRQWGNITDWVKKWTQPSDVDIEEGEPLVNKAVGKEIITTKGGDVLTRKEAKEKQLEFLADEIYKSIYASASYPTFYRDEVLEQINQVTDTELKYISKYYKKFLTQGVWLYTDIDSEFMPHTSIDETVMSRLSKIGQRG